MDKDLLQKITFLYNLSEIVKTEEIDKGFLSKNYKISTGAGDFFLKRYRFDNKEKIKEIHCSKNYFKDGGIPVILPLKTNDGETFFEYKNFYFALFPFVIGLQPERGNLSEQMIISMGVMLGQIHLLGKKSPLKMEGVFNDWNKNKALQTIKTLEEKLDQIKDKSSFDKLAQKSIALKKELIKKNNIESNNLDIKSDHLIHGDYIDQNIFFDEQGNVKYVFDFEKTKFEPRTQELFRSATYSFIDSNFNDTSIKNARLYVRSYLEIYPMSNKDLKDGLMIHYLKSIHGFWVEREHYLKDNTRADSLLKLDYKRIKFLSERLEDLL